MTLPPEGLLASDADRDAAASALADAVAARRVGRFPIGHFCPGTAAFGQFDLDLRAAVPSQQEITLTVWSVAARIAVIVPPRWRVTDQVLVLGARQAMADRDGSPREPLLRLRGTCLGGSFGLPQG